MFKAIRSFFRSRASQARTVAQMQSAHEAATDKATLKLRNENERLQTENDLLKLQVKMLVAENARNYERIKAETAGFSEQVVIATRQHQSNRSEG